MEEKWNRKTGNALVGFCRIHHAVRGAADAIAIGPGAVPGVTRSQLVLSGLAPYSSHADGLTLLALLLVTL